MLKKFGRGVLSVVGGVLVGMGAFGLLSVVVSIFAVIQDAHTTDKPLVILGLLIFGAVFWLIAWGGLRMRRRAKADAPAPTVRVTDPSMDGPGAQGGSTGKNTGAQTAGGSQQASHKALDQAIAQKLEAQKDGGRVEEPRLTAPKVDDAAKPEQPSAQSAAPVRPEPGWMAGMDVRALLSECEMAHQVILRPGVEYALLRHPQMDVFLADVRDTTGEALPAEGFAEGMTAELLLELTVAEFAQKDAPEALNALVERLLAERPADRIPGAGWLHTPDGKKREFTLAPLCLTLDERAIEADRARRARTFIGGLDRVYLMYSAAMGDRFPAVVPEGCAWVFSRVDYAEDMKKRHADLGLEYMDYGIEAFNENVASWRAIGVERFHLNPGTRDHAVLLGREAYLADAAAPDGEYLGANLNRWVLRMHQNRLAPNKTVDRVAEVQKCWQTITKLLPGQVLLVPMNYEGDPDEVKDLRIHYTQKASQRLNALALGNVLGDRVDGGMLISVEQNGGGEAMLATSTMFYGSERYRFTTPELDGSDVGRTMHMRTVVNGDKQVFLCAFTDFASYEAMFGEKTRVVAFTFMEIAENMEAGVDAGPNIPAVAAGGITGVVINPGGLNLILSRRDLMQVTHPLDADKSKFMVDEKNSTDPTDAQ